MNKALRATAERFNARAGANESVRHTGGLTFPTFATWSTGATFLKFPQHVKANGTSKNISGINDNAEPWFAARG